MHAIELADLANTFVRYVPVQLAMRCRPSLATLQEYWLTNRYRHQNWMSHLSCHRDAIQHKGTSYRNQKWHEVLPLIQEVLVSETLTRVIAYHAAVLDEAGIDREFGSLALSSLASHVETRNRCLHLIVFGQGLSVELAVKLNHLRRTMETYTDQLIATMLPLEKLAAFCFDAHQVSKSQRGLYATWPAEPWVSVHTATMADGLWRSVRGDLDWRTSNARLNHRLSQIVLQLFPTSFFNGMGVPHSCQMGAFTAESMESDGLGVNQHGPWLHPLSVIAGTDRTPSKSMRNSDRRLGLG